MENFRQERQREIGIVFLNGAGLGSWIWQEVATGLENRILAIDSPMRNGKSGVVKNSRAIALDHYADHIVERLARWDVDCFIIVAHSLGGIPAIQASERLKGRLVGMVAVGAVIPKQGESFLSHFNLPKRVLMTAVLRIFGTKPPESVIRKGLCHDISPEQASEVVRDFVPESVRVYTEPLRAPLPNVPRLYVRLTDDRTLPTSGQNRVVEAFAPHEVVSMNTGHLPMLRDPDCLRQVVQTFMSTHVVQDKE